MDQQNRHLLTLSAQIVAAHAGNNEIEAKLLPSAIISVFNALSDLNPDLFPAVAPHRNPGEEDHREHHTQHHNGSHANTGYVHPTYGQTVFPDHLICMEDGLSMKMLKRHLLTVHRMTPDEYRAKWILPENYPMVAAEYARLRSALALQSGLGLKPVDKPSRGRGR